MKENLSKQSWDLDPTQNFVKCPKLVREAPRGIQNIKQEIGPTRALRAIGNTQGPWAQIGPGPFWAQFFFDFLDGAGGLPDQFGTFCEILGWVKILFFFGKIFLHNSPPT